MGRLQNDAGVSTQDVNIWGDALCMRTSLQRICHGVCAFYRRPVRLRRRRNPTQRSRAPNRQRAALYGALPLRRDVQVRLYQCHHHPDRLVSRRRREVDLRRADIPHVSGLTVNCDKDAIERRRKTAAIEKIAGLPGPCAVVNGASFQGGISSGSWAVIRGDDRQLLRPITVKAESRKATSFADQGTSA